MKKIFFTAYILKPISIFVFFMLLMMPGAINAQIQGRILDKPSEKPVASVHVFIDSLTGTTTDNEGRFILNTERKKAEITIQHVEYETKKLFLKKSNSEYRIYLEPKDYEFHEILVSAYSGDYKHQKLPAAISLRRINETTSGNNLSVIPLFRDIPGLQVHAGALNTHRISVRGIGSRSPYNTTKLKTYIDGIPLTDGSGLSSPGDIDPDIIGKVEVIKGPHSVLYGSGLGGALIMSTKMGFPPGLSAGLSNTSGSFGLQKNNLSLTFQKKKIQTGLTSNITNNDGFRENSRYRRTSIFSKTGVEIHNKLDVTIIGGYVDLKAQIPSSLDRETYINSPEKAAQNWAAIKGFEQYEKFFTGATIHSSLHKKIQNKTTAWGQSKNSYESRPFNILSDKLTGAGIRTKFNFLLINRLDIILGAELYNEIYDWTIFETDEGIKKEILNKNNETRKNMNLFSSADISIDEKTNLTAGIHMNKTSYNISDRYDADSVDISNNHSFDAVVSPAIAIIRNLTDRFSVFASVSYGFSTPTLEETLLPEGLINTELQPETGLNLEIGSKGHLITENLYLNVSLYRIYVKNLLVTKRITEELFKEINAGRTIHNGLEAYMKYSVPAGFSGSLSNSWLSASYTLSDHRFISFKDDETDHSGKYLPGIPTHKFSVRTHLRINDNLYCHLNYLFSGKMPMNDMNSLYSKQYSLFHIKTGYSFTVRKSAHLNLFIGVNNIFDKHHASMILVNAKGFGDKAPRYYYPGQPRNVYFGLSFDIK